MKIEIRITDAPTTGPAGRLAEAAIVFLENAGPLTGLQLIGFSIWQRSSGGRNVTFPARQYAVNGERRSFALLRPAAGANSNEAIRLAILDAYDRAMSGGGPLVLDLDPKPPQGWTAIEPGAELLPEVRTEARELPAVADVPFALTPPSNDAPTAAQLPLIGGGAQ